MSDELKPWYSGKIDVVGDCWIWSKSKNSRGYGKLLIDGKLELAHRVSYRVRFGDIPSGNCVCHKCDNPACINPEHLFVGTQSDNMRDCRDKGRLDTKGNAHKTVCKHGHPFDEANTRINRNGERSCRACDREWHRKHYEPR